MSAELAEIVPTLLNAISILIQHQQKQLDEAGNAETGSGVEGTDPPPKPPANVSYASGICPDDQCKMKLYYPTHEASVECPGCGQRHSIGSIRDSVVLGEKENKIEFSLQHFRQTLTTIKKKVPELVQVRGISNYQCKLLSPLLTFYGRDNKTGIAKPLTELGMGEAFDCSKFVTRAFSIEEAQLETAGYGRDRSGSARYLTQTLERLRAANGNKTGLVPLHADGDGHCLVHAISRCLVGRELFWHALRHSLYCHLTENISRYKTMFKEFYEEEEWEKIIAEAAPDYQPTQGEVHGLRNIHVFGLANVLRRPIVLLDSLLGLKSSGDYSGLFLPAIHPPSDCSTVDPTTQKACPHSPIVVAWSSSGRNHFVPLVPIRGQPLPKLPPSLCPKVWGVGEDLVKQYVEFDAGGCVEVCSGKPLSDPYIQKLVKCMETLFFEKNGVHISLVADLHRFVRTSGCVGLKPEFVIEMTRSAVEQGRLFRCLMCNLIVCVPVQWLEKGGPLYVQATSTSPHPPADNNVYQFPKEGVIATYSASTESFVLKEVSCFHCAGVTRSLRADGSIAYMNGDRTMTPAVRSQCGCGYRHYWDGQEYDNLPERIPLSLTFGNRTVQLTVHWFQRESDPERNSNAYDVAQKVINDHFPGEFGSERLVQQIVDSIMKATEKSLEQVAGHHPPTPDSDDSTHPFNKEEAHKTILTGPKSTSIHKEELGLSSAERRVRAKVEENARVQQRKRSAMADRHTDSSSKTSQQPPKRTPVPQKSSAHSVTTSTTAPLTPSLLTTPTSSPSSSSSSSPPASKKIKVTSSDGRTANLTLDPSTTFLQLQAAIERELSIPPEQQRLRWGFPPRELRPSADPTHPVELTNGERVSVDVVPSLPPAPAPTDTTTDPAERGRGAREERDEEEDEDEEYKARVKRKEQEVESAQRALDHIIQQLHEVAGAEFDLWTVAQYQPHFFAKGGDYYKQVVRAYGGNVVDNTHFQFREFPGKTFAFNKKEERLEVCLGNRHMPVGPLSTEEEELARDASVGSPRDHKEEGNTMHSGVPQTMGLSGAVSRSNAAATAAAVRAFSGRGQTLGSRHEQHESSDS